MAKRGNGEGSIYRRKDGRWTAEMSLEGGKSKFIYGKTRKEVQEKAQDQHCMSNRKGCLLLDPNKKSDSFLPIG